MTELAKNSTRISDDDTMKLLHLYFREDCLWNTQSEWYKCPDRRKLAYERVVAKLGIPNFGWKQVAAKVKNLRNAYCQELKKMASSQILGFNYKPVAFWFPLVNSFLRAYVQPRALERSDNVENSSGQLREYYMKAMQMVMEDSPEMIVNKDKDVEIKPKRKRSRKKNKPEVVKDETFSSESQTKGRFKPTFALSDQQIVQLLQLYRNAEMLWNKSALDYRNTALKDQKMREIVQTLNIKGFEVKHLKLKIKTYRDKYLKEMRRNTPGLARDTVWFPIMTFLDRTEGITTKTNPKNFSLENKVKHKEIVNVNEDFRRKISKLEPLPKKLRLQNIEKRLNPNIEGIRFKTQLKETSAITQLKKKLPTTKIDEMRLKPNVVQDISKKRLKTIQEPKLKEIILKQQLNDIKFDRPLQQIMLMATPKPHVEEMRLKPILEPKLTEIIIEPQLKKIGLGPPPLKKIERIRHVDKFVKYKNTRIQTLKVEPKIKDIRAGSQFKQISIHPPPLQKIILIPRAPEKIIEPRQEEIKPPIQSPIQLSKSNQLSIQPPIQLSTQSPTQPSIQPPIQPSIQPSIPQSIQPPIEPSIQPPIPEKVLKPQSEEIVIDSQHDDIRLEPSHEKILLEQDNEMNGDLSDDELDKFIDTILNEENNDIDTYENNNNVEQINANETKTDFEDKQFDEVNMVENLINSAAPIEENKTSPVSNAEKEIMNTDNITLETQNACKINDTIMNLNTSEINQNVMFNKMNDSVSNDQVMETPNLGTYIYANSMPPQTCLIDFTDNTVEIEHMFISDYKIIPISMY